MMLISTSSLRRITIFILAVAIVSFGAAEVHKRFIVPRQQATVPLSSPASEYTVPTPTPDLDRFELIESITGVFQKWEEVPNSSDKYAILIDLQTGESFPKVRVGFEFSPLYGDGSGREDATVFAAEKGEGEYNVLGYLKDFTSEEINKIIRLGDSVKIILKKGTDRVGNVTDEDKNLLAHWVFVEGGLGEE